MEMSAVYGLSTSSRSQHEFGCTSTETSQGARPVRMEALGASWCPTHPNIHIQYVCLALLFSKKGICEGRERVILSADYLQKNEFGLSRIQFSTDSRHWALKLS
jgi:hypothetical protein